MYTQPWVVNLILYLKIGAVADDDVDEEDDEEEEDYDEEEHIFADGASNTLSNDAPTAHRTM